MLDNPLVTRGRKKAEFINEKKKESILTDKSDVW